MPTFEKDLISFHYIDLGEGIPFVFQHGMGGDTHQTLETFQSPFPLRLLTMDCRGHGETQPLNSPGELSFNQFGDDLLDFIDHLHLQTVVIGGISMGAGVALNVSLRYPHKVRALVLVRPAWLEQPNPVNLQVYPHIAELIRRHGVEKACEIFQHTEKYQQIKNTFPATAASLVKQFTRSWARERVEILEQLPLDTPNRTREDWSRLRIPTLILANELDPVHPLPYAQALAQTIPNTRLEMITPKEMDPERHTRDIQGSIERFFLTII